jgi:hypothetical protein
MNHTRLPKEVLLPDSGRRDNKVTKGDRVDLILKMFLIFSLRNLNGTLINGQWIPKDIQANTNTLILGNIPEFGRNEEVTQNFSRYILSFFIV